MYGNVNLYERERLSSSAALDKDVVYLDIWGNGMIPRLRRWWHDLFLLSYSDSRSKYYYTSSYAMKMARTAQYRHNRNNIHPFSKFRNFWDCVILYLLLIRIVLFHLNTSIIHNTHVFCHYLVAAIEYVFILDLCVNAKTGYAIVQTRQIVMKSHDIILHYLSTYAFIHAMSAIPLQNLMFLRLGKLIDVPKYRANMFVPTLNLISLIHIARLFQASEHWAKDRGSFKRTVTFKFIRIVVVGLVVIIQILTFTYSLHVMYSVATGNVLGVSGLGNLLQFIYQPKPDRNYNDDTFFLFLKMGRIAKTFFLFGYTLFPNTEWCDRLAAILTHAVAFAFHFWAAVVLYNCLTRVDYLEDRISVHRSQCFSVLRVRRLPDTIHERVAKYFDYRMSSLAVIENTNNLYKSLPHILVSEIKMACYRKYVSKIPCFSNWPPEVISKIVELLEREIYLNDDIVSAARSPRDGMVIVEAGLLAVYIDKEEVGHLMDGDHLGELALVTDQEADALTLVAITASTVLLLEKIHFRAMMRQYPELFYSLRGQSTKQSNENARLWTQNDKTN